LDGLSARCNPLHNHFAISAVLNLLEIKNNGKAGAFPEKFGAGNETRTRDLYLGKVSLYQLSYSRKKRSPHYRDIKCSVKKNGVIHNADVYVFANVVGISV
jgi:hypothetical protein